MRSFNKSKGAEKAIAVVRQQAKDVRARYAPQDTQAPDMRNAKATIREMLEPFIPNIEAFRQNMLAELKERKARAPQVALFICGGCFAAAFVVIAPFCPAEANGCMSEIFSITLVLSLISIMFLPFWMNAPARDYVNNFKRDILPIVLRAYDPSFYYVHEDKKGFSDIDAAKKMWNGYKGYPEVQLLMKSGFFDLYKTLPGYNRDDCIRGTYKNVNFSFIEATIGAGKYESYIFKGGIFILDFNQSFSGHTLLMRNAAKFKKMFNKGQSRANGQPYQRVEMEDPVFEKKFEVFGTDQQEARYILTPSLMERLQTISLGRYSNDKAVEAAFFENYAIIFVSYSDNLFEPPDINTAVTDIEPIILILEEFDTACKIIDELKMVAFAKRRVGAAKMEEMASNAESHSYLTPNVAKPRRKSTAPTNKSPFT